MKETVTPAEFMALKKEIQSSLHCALPGIVASFDALTQTAAVRPALKGKAALPLIRDVPVFFPGARDSAVTFPVSAGDECLLVFADADIDSWFETGEVKAAVSARRHDLSDAFAFVGFRSRPNALRDFPAAPRFFDGAVLSHNHDGRYYTETETDTLLSGKSGTNHRHAAGDITSGTLALARGGSGQSGTGSSTAAAEIAAGASGCTVTSAQYAYWGKLAMVRLVIKKTAAVSSGTTTLATLAEGKRPRYTAMAERGMGEGARISSSGEVQVFGSISAGESITVLSTYILA